MGRQWKADRRTIERGASVSIVRSGDAKIYYEVHGSGETLVLAHGAGGNTEIWWQQVPYFSTSYRVVTFDHRCFGRSLCPPESFKPASFGEDLVAILDAEKIDRIALVCQSMGGWTGMRMALDHPDRLSCLVLCGTPGGIVTDQIIAAAARISEVAAASGIKGNAALAESFQLREPGLSFLYDQIGSHNTGFSPRLLGELANARIDPNELKAYSTPTLVISGEEDALFPTQAIRGIAELIPGAELKTIPGSGHSPYFEVPDIFNQVVGEFLARQAN
jgi:pimeloyl-ACP methyl ester carboxylesterase